MSNQELCTQYQLIISMLKSGKTDEVIEILESAVNRIDKGSTKNKDSEK